MLYSINKIWTLDFYLFINYFPLPFSMVFKYDKRKEYWKSRDTLKGGIEAKVKI